MQLLPGMNVMLDFICMGSMEVQGARGKRKIKYSYQQRDWNTQRQDSNEWASLLYFFSFHTLLADQLIPYK